LLRRWILRVLRKRFEEIAVCLAELLHLDGCLRSLYPKDIGGDTVLLALCAILRSLLTIPERSDIIPTDRLDLGDLSVNPRLILSLHHQQTL
jgi:hypothetical protein